MSPIVIKSLFKILQKNSLVPSYQIMFNKLLERLVEIYKVDGTEVKFYLDIQALRIRLQIKDPSAFQQWQIREDKEIGLRHWSITDSVEDVIHHGAFCTIKKNHTIALNLYSNNLKLLPSSIGSLIELKYLYLENNKLITLPESIGNLRNLKILDLSYNKLKTLPIEFGNLNDLMVLNINYNNLKTIPTSIGRLNNLVQLSIYKNYVSTLPIDTKNLTSLIYIDLGWNVFKEIPESIFYLSNLEYLYFSMNQIKVIPKEIGNLKNLKVLDLRASTLFRKLDIPTEIKDLKKLRVLNLEDNWDYSVGEKALIQGLLPNCEIDFPGVDPPKLQPIKFNE